MTEIKITLTNPSGLHARPAAQFAQAAGRFKTTTVKVAKGAREVDAKSIISVMSLGAAQGTELTLRADGPDEKEVIQLLVAMNESAFGEGA